MSAISQPLTSSVKIVSRDGRTLDLTDELFEAFSDFMARYKRSGSITCHFSHGKLVEVVSLTKKIYK